MRYRFTGPSPVSIPALSLELQPGDVFETEDELNHLDFELLKQAPVEPKKTPSKSPAVTPSKEA